ncbi:MAG: TlpA family protein disulfide reductase [Gemmatimonadetes bacterium]|nr:MAG: TlpA family protein disulfide reductase [Gemmatimonadota bacterium]
MESTRPERPRPSRLPYLFALVVLSGVVGFAWVAREHFQPIVAGSEAPDFSVVDEEGRIHTLDDFRGKVVIVNVWATWCPPCVEEMPSLDALYKEFEGTDLELVAISVDAPPGKADAAGKVGGDPWAFARELGVSFPIYWDRERRVERAYQTTGVPESFVIGRDGIIYKKVAGATVWDHDRYRELIERLLAS